MSKRKYYKPGREGGRFVLRGKLNLEIGPRGYSTEDVSEISVLDNHPLNGYEAGFIEVEAPSLRRKKERAKKLGQIKKTGSPGKETSDGNSKKEKTQKKGSGGDKDPDTEPSPTEGIKTVNQAKDYLIELGVDGKKLTSKDKILKAAKELDPPVEFSNL